MDRYNRLKSNTKRWVQWLCSTADQHGSPTQTTPRPNGNLLNVTTQEILRQALYLESFSKSNDIKYTMPRDIWQAYKSAFRERMRYAARYAEDDQVQLGNAGHDYFNGVMDSVQRLLSDCVDVVVVARSTQDTDVEAPPETLATVFERLSITDHAADIEDEEEEDDDDDLPEHSSGVFAQDKPTLEPLMPPAYESKMKMYCLREHLEERAFNFIRGPWNGKKPTSTVVASFLTNAAVSVVGEWEEALMQRDENTGFSIATNATDPMFLAFLTLRDVADERERFGKGYRTGLKPLNVQHPNDNFGLDGKMYNTMFSTFHYAVQVMMELYLESDMLNLWSDENSGFLRFMNHRAALPIGCRDEVSKALQTVNQGSEFNVVQTALAFKIVMFTGQPGEEDPRSALSALKTLCGTQQDYISEITNRTEFPEMLAITTLLNEWTTIRAWVCDGPAHMKLSRDTWRRNHQTASENAKQRLEGAILPTEDPEMLRKMNPTLCGTLDLALRVLSEEVGLSMLNHSPTVFSMCYLYKTLKSKDRLSEDCIMHDIEKLIELHGPEMFDSLDFSESVNTINNTRKLQSGASLASLSAKPSTSTTQATGFKTWDIKTSTTISLLRDVVHGRMSFSGMLHRLDKMMTEELAAKAKLEFKASKSKKAKAPEKSSKGKMKAKDESAEPTHHTLKQISLLETDIVAFMEKLREYFEEALKRLSFEYMTVHCVCQSLFEEMSAKMGPLPARPPPPTNWKKRTIYTVHVVDAVFNQLTWVLNEEARQAKRKKITKTKIEANLVDVAVDVLERYCRKGGTGFAVTGSVT